MKVDDTIGSDTVAPRQQAEASRPSLGRSKRVLGTAALALITSVAVVLPTQATAHAAPANDSVRLSSVSGATSGLSALSAKRRGLSQAVYEHRLQTWANRARHAHDVRRIEVRPCHDGYAERWTGYLARNNLFQHQDLGPYMDSCNLSKAGEILALGKVTPRKMVRMWLGSPEHRHILLDGSFGLSGIAARRDANGYWIGCIDFGRKM